ncbi:MAG: 2-oxoacid:acceptor oxidoreductase family protein [Coriobacteriia bacterium]|nr:2-oxoacid:acceptor oxidoreductase family protein [Coriobacteriia bacterium]
MIEVLWHGRGGQGAFTAARLLGAACSFADGRYALAFPSFGPERRGAPMRAFTKFGTAPIGDRSAVEQADYVIYLDETLLAPGWEQELKPGGRVLVNTKRVFADERLVGIDADGIASELLGRPIPNTVFLGALAALCPQVSADDAKEAVRQYMAPKLHERNVAVIDHVVATAGEWAQARGADVVEEPEASGADLSPQDACPDAPERRIPTLRSGDLDPAVYARTTCWDGGYLVSRNAGWRQVRPVVDAAACTGCLVCYMQCPDGTVYKRRDAQAGESPVGIDLDFCKGCGICARCCKFGAIRMVNEVAALAEERAAQEGAGR